MSKKSWSYAMFEGVRQAMGRDRNLVLTSSLGIASYPGLPDINLEKEFGSERVIDYTSIDEFWYNAAAYGSALMGNKGIYYHKQSMANPFPIEMWSQHVAKTRHMTGGQAVIPMVLVVSFSGQAPGMAGQHSDYEEDTWYAHIPGARTVAPTTVYDVKGLMIHAMMSNDPVAVINYGGFAALQDDVPDTPYEVDFGKAAVRTRGNDLTIVTSGAGALDAKTAVERLQKDGMSVELIDLVTLNPMDTETLVKSVQKTKRLITFDQSKYTLCPGAEVMARCAEGVPGAKFRRIAYPDSPPPGAPEMFLWMKPNDTHLYEAAKKLVG
jgi:pyruvate dehydrogenase E1 component beta subunit